MKTVFYSFLLLVSASLGFAAEEAREAEVDDIHEAVFRWQFVHNASGLQTNAQVYFLQIGEKRGDPTDEFIGRFAGHKPPVRKVSACSAGAGTGVVDKKTGEKGMIFRITQIKWKSATEVDVSGGYYEAGESASSNTYTVKKVKGKWKVTGDKMLKRA